MGIFDKFKDKAGELKSKAAELAETHSDKINEGLDKAGNFANEKTGGAHGDKINQGIDQAKSRLQGLSGNSGTSPAQPDLTEPGPTEPGPAEPGPAEPGRPA